MTTRYKVIGPSTSGGFITTWHWSTRKDADTFAKFMVGEIGDSYEIAEVVGVWRRTAPPVEWVPVEDVDAN